MSHPLRIQRKRTKGWKMPEGAIYVGRPGPFGNPFESVEEFRGWLSGEPPENLLEMTLEEVFTLTIKRKRILDSLKTLRGKQIACWCSLDKPCHADVLAEMASKS